MGRIKLFMVLAILTLMGCSKRDSYSYSVKIIGATNLYESAPLRPDDETGKVLIKIPEGNVVPLEGKIYQKEFLVLKVKYKDISGFIIFDNRNILLIESE